jgi:phosphatidylinositol alpha-1,6-mannosyltransferase
LPSRRILFITRKYPPVRGGMEQYSYDLYRSWSEREDVTLLSNPEGNAALPRFFVRAVSKVLSEAAAFDLVHLGDGVLAPLIPFVRARSKARIGITIHGLDITYGHYGYQTLFPALVARADRVVCVSSYTRDACVERGVPASKTLVIPNGIDLSRLPVNRTHTRASLSAKYGFELGPNLLFSVGRLVKRKGHSMFVREYMPRLKSRFVYAIAGDGPDRAAIESVVSELGLYDHVRLLGGIDEEEKAFLLGYAKGYVMPNVRVPNDPEGFGISVLEAVAHRLPVFTTGIEGIADQKRYCYPLERLLDEPYPERSGEEWDAIRASIDWKRVIDAYVRDV